MRVLFNDNASTEFENFIIIFSMHFNHCCPIKKIKIKQYKHDKP